MDLVWKNLEFIEENYEKIFLKTHRIQANRVCLGDLTGKKNSYLCSSPMFFFIAGVDFAGEKHPINCPCEKREEKERLDRERLQRRKTEEDEKKLQVEQEETV